MKTRLAVMLAVVGGAAALSNAQQITPGQVNYTLEFTRVDAAGAVLGPGAVAEGESARLQLRVNYTPNGGAPGSGGAVTYPASILTGSSGAGTVVGFWAGAMNVVGTGGAEGTWADSSVTTPTALRRRLLPPFSAAGVGGAGTVAAGGATIENVQPGQFGASVFSLATTNNFIAWQGVFTPASYAERTVTFNLALSSLGLSPALLAVADNNEMELPVAGTVAHSFGSVSFQVVPAPSSLALLGLGGLVALRRRR